MKVYAICDKYGTVVVNTSSRETEIGTCATLCISANKDTIVRQLKALNMFYGYDCAWEAKRFWIEEREMQEGLNASQGCITRISGNR